MVQILNASGLSALATLGYVQRSGQRGTIDQGQSADGVQRPLVDARPINAGFATVAAAVFGVSRTGIPPFANAAPNNFNLLAIGGVNSTINALTADARLQEAAEAAAEAEAARTTAAEGGENVRAPAVFATNSGGTPDLENGPEPSATPSSLGNEQNVQSKEMGSSMQNKPTGADASQVSPGAPRGTFTDLLV